MGLVLLVTLALVGVGGVVGVGVGVVVGLCWSFGVVGVVVGVFLC